MALLTACATEPRTITQYVETETDCTVPELPALPVVMWGEIEGSDDALDRLEAYEAALVDSLNVHRKKLKSICGEPEQ